MGVVVRRQGLIPQCAADVPILDEWSANRNVWSAASPQAKCEDVTSWSAQMYTAFVGVNHSWPGWNALRSFPH